MDEVGLRLIQITKQGMNYKTDEATGQGPFSNNSKGISIRNLYWNKARPVFTKPPVMTAAKSLSLARKAAMENPKPVLSLRFDGPVITLTGIVHYKKRYLQTFEIGKTSVVLVRDPQHPNDANAIRVEDVSSQATIGYIEKKDAAILAPWLVEKALLRIDYCVMNHRVGDSTIYLLLKGWACEPAKDMLASL